MGKLWNSSEHLKYTVLSLWFVPVDPCFIRGVEMTLGLLRTALNQHQTFLWNSFTVGRVVRSEKMRLTAFSYKIFYAVYDWRTRFHKKPTTSVISRAFNEDSVETYLWALVSYTSTVIYLQFLTIASKKKRPPIQHLSYLIFSGFLPKTRIKSRTDNVLFFF